MPNKRTSIHFHAYINKTLCVVITQCQCAVVRYFAFDEIVLLCDDIKLGSRPYTSNKFQFQNVYTLNVANNASAIKTTTKF